MFTCYFWDRKVIGHNLCTCRHFLSVLQWPKLLYNTSPQHFSTTLLHNTSLQHFSTTLLYDSSAQHFSTTLLHNTPVLLRTTKYYSVLLCTTPVLLRSTLYYEVLQSTTPVLLKVLLQYYSVLQSSTPYYKVLLQYYSVLQSTTPVLLCTTKYYTSLQNQPFVGGFRNFSSNKLPKRAFRARLPQLFKQQASKMIVSYEASLNFNEEAFKTSVSRVKTSISCETSFKFHFQLENRRFRASFSYKAIFTELKKYDFCEASATFLSTNQMLRLPRYLK